MKKEDIIALLKKTVLLLELHGANPFQVKYYRNAVWDLEQHAQDLAKLPTAVSKNTQKLYSEICTTGTLVRWEELMAITPKGVLDMLDLQGIGPKKVNVLWEKLKITSLKELDIACHQDKVAKLPGFGKKTQAKILASITFKRAQEGKFHYAQARIPAHDITQSLKESFPTSLISFTGAMRRKMEVVQAVDLLIGTDHIIDIIYWLDQQPALQKDIKKSGPFSWRGKFKAYNLVLSIVFCKKRSFQQHLIIQTGSSAHLALSVTGTSSTIGEQIYAETTITHEAAFYQRIGLPYIPPELREGLSELAWAQKSEVQSLIDEEALRGVLHNHTTYSDGKHSIEAMAQHCIALGYEYIGITDHSQQAVYAGGLTIEEVKRQHEEIDRLNTLLAPFKIFKGIEVEIHSDGTLDYDEDILVRFDFVIAAIHAGMTMNKQQATARLIKAIKNPYTTILAHPTNRLLLKRVGFPIDYPAVIDACAQHKVAIEINANPWRLELDWRWIHYALRKKVKISINPDAHDKSSIAHMYYGVCVGRKGGLTKRDTLNTLGSQEIAQYFDERKASIHRQKS